MNSLLDGTPDVEIIDPNKSYRDIMIGPGGKFYDPDREVAIEKMARGKYEADLTIATSNRRQDELRTDYLALREQHDAGAKLKDYIDQLSSKSQQLTSSEHTQANEVQNKPYDPKEIDDRISARFNELQNSQKQEQNLDLVKGKLQETFGSNYKSHLKEQANTLGLSDDDVEALARKSPTAFLKAFGLDGQAKTEGFQAPVNSTQRKDPFAPNVGKRTWAYYQSMKAKDPKAYYDAKTQNQMIDDYRALGDAFEDGNYKNI